MMMAASSGVAVRRLAAARTARRGAAGICTKGSGFVPAAQHLTLPRDLRPNDHAFGAWAKAFANSRMRTHLNLIFCMSVTLWSVSDHNTNHNQPAQQAAAAGAWAWVAPLPRVQQREPVAQKLAKEGAAKTSVAERSTEYVMQCKGF